MNIEIEIRDQGIIVLATMSIDGVKMLTLPFRSVDKQMFWRTAERAERFGK